MALPRTPLESHLSNTSSSSSRRPYSPADSSSSDSEAGDHSFTLSSSSHATSPDLTCFTDNPSDCSLELDYLDLSSSLSIIPSAAPPRETRQELIKRVRYQDSLEPLLSTITRKSLYPLQYPKIWQFYKQAQASFWTSAEIDLTLDLNDFERKMTEGERYFV